MKNQEAWQQLLFAHNKHQEAHYIAKVEEFKRTFLQWCESNNLSLVHEDWLPVVFDEIPALFNLLQLSVEPIRIHCYSALITDDEVRKMADYLISRIADETQTDIEPFEGHSLAVLYEMIYSIPALFKLNGFQIFRATERKFVNEATVEKLARAIHAQYRLLMKKSIEMQPDANVYDAMYISNASKEYLESEYDQLPDDIKSSNIDNAYHIPIKLLAIGYKIEKVGAGIEAPYHYLSDSDVETMAAVEHLRWSWEKRLNGFTYAPERNDALKKHNCLVPYHELSEFEKEKDRVLVRLIPALLKDIGFEIIPIDETGENPFIYKARVKAKIDEIKLGAESLRMEIENWKKDQLISVPEKISNLLTQIEQGAGEVSGAFSSAVSIQRTYLPSPLYFRECLPDSFLLYKPKDAVGGDFYFVTQKYGAVVWVCADCTGHGISAGLLTAICYNYIDQTVNQQNITDPAAIIANVMPKVEYLMRRNDGNLENRSGMELAVCTFYPPSNILFYAGLNRSLYHITNGQLNEIEAARYKESFEAIAPKLKTQILQVNPNDTVYLTSDGYIDQFGGTRDKMGERFKTKRFKELLLSVQPQSMVQQRDTFNQTIEKWKQEAGQDQTDDILVIGVRF